MKQTIIMIHGFRGTHHGLAKIAESLGDEYSLVVPDIPGFGEGETLKHYDLASYVAWLHRLVKSHKGSSRPILLGHSFGSIIAASYAARYPKTIAKLILVNPIGAPALEGPRGILTKLAQGYYWLGSILPEKAARRWLATKSIVFIMSTTMAKTSDKTLRKWIHQQHYTYFSTFHSAASVSEAFTTSVSHSVRDIASNITPPTLLIAGDKDDITPLPVQEELHRLMPTSTLRVIKNVGHLTHYETPNEVAKIVQDFIKSE
jgi:pimeloyl-ACP methyl ester carboxylesterase